MASDFQGLPFEDILICATGFSGEEKEDIHRKVREMGGEFSANLSRSVTHVIAKSVGSQKYKKAAELSIPIVYPEWVHNSYLKWTAKKYFHARQNISAFILPPFLELVICVTGLTVEDRDKIKDLTEANGGTYSSDLTRKVTHLIAQEPGSKKYDFARRSGIPVVSKQWFTDSIQSLTCADASKYPIPAIESTIMDLDFGPASFNSNSLSLSFSTPNSGRFRKEPSFPKTFSPGPQPQKPELIAKTSNLSDMYLDGCNIYLGDGFSSQKLSYLRRIILEGGGTRRHEYSAGGVTHFVISGRTPTKMDLACLTKDKDAGQMPLFVTEDWLHECHKENALLDTEKYLGDILNWNREAESTTPSNVCASDRSRTSSVSRTSRALRTSTPKERSKLTIRKSRLSTGSRYSINEILDDLVFDPSQENTGSQSTHNSNSQFKKTSSRQSSIDFDGGISSRKSAIEANKSMHKNELAFSKNTTAKVKAADFAESNSTQPTQSTLFSDTIFDAFGFGSQLVQTMEKEVVKHGGIFISPQTTPTEEQRRNLTWYTIVRLKCRLDELPKEHGILVTGCWLDRCLNDHQIYSPNDHISFAPLTSASKFPIAEFTKYQIGVSGYDDLERVHLGLVVEILGARYTQNFSRCHTHLLSCVPEGPKYTKAKEWGIPTITADWIYQCAKQEKLIPLDNFFVDLAASMTSYSTTNNSEEPHIISLGDTESPTEPKEPELAESSMAGIASIDTKRGISVDLLEDLSPSAVAARLAMVEHNMSNMTVSPLVDVQKESVQSKAILEGTILCLSKGLNNRQIELHALITQLGGKWVSSFDDTVTHFIHQGKNTREVSRLVAQRQVPVVSPVWLQQCFERSCRLNEEDFPYTYIPGRSNCLVFTQDPSTRHEFADESEEGRENVAPINAIPNMTGTKCRPTGKTDAATLQELIEKASKDDMSKRRTRGIIRRSVTEQSSGAENGDSWKYVSKISRRAEKKQQEVTPIYQDPDSHRQKRKLLDDIQLKQNKKIQLSPDPEEKHNGGDDKDSVVSWGESKTGKNLYRSRTMDSEVPRLSGKDLTLSDERSTVPLAQRENSNVQPSVSSRSELLGMTMTDFTISGLLSKATSNVSEEAANADNRISLRRAKTNDSFSTTSSKKKILRRGSNRSNAPSEKTVKSPTL